jgi:hypothetical protein
MALKVAASVFKLNGDLTGLFEAAHPLVFGRNTP